MKDLELSLILRFTSGHLPPGKQVSVSFKAFTILQHKYTKYINIKVVVK